MPPKKRKNSGPNKHRPHKKIKQGKKPQLQDIALPDDIPEEVHVSDDDMDFVSSAGKSLSFLTNLDAKQLDQSVKAKQRQAVKSAAAADAAAANDGSDAGYDSNDDAEAYERAPRRVSEGGKKVPSRGLPVKTADGALQYEPKAVKPQSATQMVNVAGVVVEDALDEEAAAEAARKLQQQQEARQRQEEAAKRAAAEKLQQRRLQDATGGQELPAALQQLQRFQSQADREERLREVMAAAAQKLLEHPEAAVGELRTLVVLLADEDPKVARLAMLSCLAVFKDILPGYRIRPPTEKELEVKVSKDVQKTRDFESALLKHYQGYLKALLAAANSLQQGRPPHSARIAVRCMTTLLVSLSHFNYTSDLLQAVVPRMASWDPEIRSMCCEAVQQLLGSSPQWQVSVEAVQLVADLVKMRRCVCPGQVVGALLVLRFEEIKVEEEVEVRRKKSQKSVKKKKGGKKGKEDEVDRDFKESQAAADVAEIAAAQSQMLDALFEIFFRVLKQTVGGAQEKQRQGARGGGDAGARGEGEGGGWSSEDVGRRFPLLEPVLRGLGRYSHLLSVEYFNDIMEVFKQLLSCAALPLASRLQCLQTAADVLRGHGEALNIDRRDLYSHLYALMLAAPLQQLLDSEAMDTDAGPSTSGSDDSAGVRLCRVAHQMLCETKATDMPRLGAFLKRAASTAMHSSSGDAMGLLAVAFRLLRRYPKLTNLLEWEGEAPVGGRSYNPSCPDPSEAGALAACLWELPMLAAHYHPAVRQAVSAITTLHPGSQAQPSGPLTQPLQPHELAASYSTALGSFRPAPAKPGRHQQRSAAFLRSVPFTPQFAEAAALPSSQPDAAVEAASTSTGSWEEAGVAEEAAEAALMTHYRLTARHQRNHDLRRESQRLAAQLQQFQMHLAQKARAASAASAASVGGSGSKAAPGGSGSAPRSKHALQNGMGKHEKVQRKGGEEGAGEVQAAEGKAPRQGGKEGAGKVQAVAAVGKAAAGGGVGVKVGGVVKKGVKKGGKGKRKVA